MLLLMAMDAGFVPTVLRELYPVRPLVAVSLVSYGSNVRRYMVVTTVLGIAQGIVNWIALLILGVPGAFIWGLLAFVCSFIPNIGYFIAIIPPIIFGGLVGGWPTVIAVIVVYGVINAVIQSVIQPRVVGKAVNLSQTITFFSVLFWAVVIGPIGAILAIPLTLLVRLLLVDTNRAMDWIRPDARRAGRDEGDHGPVRCRGEGGAQGAQGGGEGRRSAGAGAGAGVGVGRSGDRRLRLEQDLVGLLDQPPPDLGDGRRHAVGGHELGHREPRERRDVGDGHLEGAERAERRRLAGRGLAHRARVDERRLVDDESDGGEAAPIGVGAAGVPRRDLPEPQGHADAAIRRIARTPSTGAVYTLSRWRCTLACSSTWSSRPSHSSFDWLKPDACGAAFV